MQFKKKNRKERTPEEKVRRGLIALMIVAIIYIMALFMPLPSLEKEMNESETGIEQLMNSQLDSVLAANGFKHYTDMETCKIEHLEFFPRTEAEDTIDILETRIRYLENNMNSANESMRTRYNLAQKKLKTLQEQHESFLADSSNIKEISCRRIRFTVSDTIKLTCFQNIAKGQKESYLTNIITME